MTAMATPGRGHNGRFVRGRDTAERDAEACRLRTRGHSFQQIADTLGFTDRSLARRAVQRALAEVVHEAATEYVQVQLEQLDALTVEALRVLEGEHLVASAGRLVLGPDGEPLVDGMPKLNAIDRLLRIMERRAKLLGLDAPTRHAVTTADVDLDAAVGELFDVLQQAAQEDARRELEAGDAA